MWEPLTLRTIPDKVRCGISGNFRKIPGRYYLVSARLRNFVKVSGCTGFCVDAENAAVWAPASSAFSVSPLAKFCTPWYLRSSDLSQYQMIPAANFLLIFLLYPHTGNPLSVSSSHAPAINARILNGTSLYSGQITAKNTNSTSTISATQMAAYTPFRTFSFLTVTSKRFPYPITIK